MILVAVIGIRFGINCRIVVRRTVRSEIGSHRAILVAPISVTANNLKLVAAPAAIVQMVPFVLGIFVKSNECMFGIFFA